MPEYLNQYKKILLQIMDQELHNHNNKRSGLTHNVQGPNPLSYHIVSE